LSSLQFTSMNTLVYADTREVDTGQASTIVSTAQQMSMSFGVAIASLIASLLVPNGNETDKGPLLSGIHRAFIALGTITVFSSLIFRQLKRTDGASISRHGVETEPTA
jgi:hypothetical protein